MIIPHFNDGDSAFYVKFFYGRWGGSFSGIIENMIRHPNRVVSDAVQHDRIKFYKQLVAPLAGLPLLVAGAPADGGAADAGQRDRRLAVRPHDPVPVHVGHRRPR